MRKATVTMLILILGISVLAYAEPWKTTIESNLGINQNAYSDNWQGGAASGFSWISSINAIAEKQMSAVIYNKNTLKLSFGQTHTKDIKTQKWQSPVKSSDQIDHESLFRITKGWVVDPFIAGRFESQFLDQSNPTKNYNLDPWRFTESFGAAKTMLKSEKSESNLRLGAAFRQYSDYGIYDTTRRTATRNYSNDGGIQLDADYKTAVNAQLTFTSKLTLFQAVFNTKAEKLKGLPNEKYWQSPDMNWENNLTGHLTKFIAMSIDTQWLYDKEIDKAGRFKQTMSLGMTYLFKL